MRTLQPFLFPSFPSIVLPSPGANIEELNSLDTEML